MANLLVRIQEERRERTHGLAIEVDGQFPLEALAGFLFCRTDPHLRVPPLKKTLIETVEIISFNKDEPVPLS